MPKARVGYALGYGAFTNVAEMANIMRQAEERGFEMAFFSETIELMRDSVTSLAGISLATRKMVLGTTQIVRLRGPVVMAQSLATLDELSGGRITAAPGACTKSHARVHALPQDVGATPSEVLREYIESMRLLLSGDKVSYHGKFQCCSLRRVWQPPPSAGALMAAGGLPQRLLVQTSMHGPAQQVGRPAPAGNAA